MTALAVTLSWALLVDSLWLELLVDKPPHLDKVSSIEGVLLSYLLFAYMPDLMVSLNFFSYMILQFRLKAVSKI